MISLSVYSLSGESVRKKTVSEDATVSCMYAPTGRSVIAFRGDKIFDGFVSATCINERVLTLKTLTCVIRLFSLETFSATFRSY